jgi:ActR/RegA family two-component response regulator
MVGYLLANSLATRLIIKPGYNNIGTDFEALKLARTNYRLWA